MVGKYERLRSHDQMEIQKLKDRLHILNTTTNETVVADIRNLENDLNVNTGNLADVFAKLKEILRFHFQNQEDLESSKSFVLYNIYILLFRDNRSYFSIFQKLYHIFTRLSAHLIFSVPDGALI